MKFHKKLCSIHRYGLELHIVSHEKRFGTFAEAVQIKDGIAVLGILFHVSEHFYFYFIIGNRVKFMLCECL